MSFCLTGTIYNPIGDDPWYKARLRIRFFNKPATRLPAYPMQVKEITVGDGGVFNVVLANPEPGCTDIWTYEICLPDGVTYCFEVDDSFEGNCVNLSTIIAGIQGLLMFTFPRLVELTLTGPTANVDMSAGQIFNITLVGDVTMDFINLSNGMYILNIIQDAVGGHTPTLNNTFWPSGTIPSLIATAGKRAKVLLDYDGTELDAFLVGINYS